MKNRLHATSSLEQNGSDLGGAKDLQKFLRQQSGCSPNLSECFTNGCRYRAAPIWFPDVHETPSS